MDVIRQWLHWLHEDPALANRVRRAGKQLMINGTDGNPEEVTRILTYKPDWILIDDIVQFRESLDELK